MTAASHLITAEELSNLSHGECRYELVKGELLTMSPSGSDHGVVTMNLSLFVGSYIKTHQLGVAFAAETGFRLEQDPDTVLAPDFAFVRGARLGSASPGYVELAPDLAVEVISSNETRKKVETRARQWLSFGVRSAWLVGCASKTVEVFSADGTRTLLTESEELRDEDVLPGFRTLVATIFH